jgi:hypothetical protein
MMNRREWWALATLGLLITGVTTKSACHRARPVSVEVRTVGGGQSQRPWHLRVDGSGSGDLTIDSHPKPAHKRLKVSAQQLAALEAAVEREQFFGLADEYGEDLPGTRSTVISVNVRGREKVVTLRYLLNWVHNEPERLREPARALRILQVVRGWLGWLGDETEDGHTIAMVLAAAGGTTTR